MISLVSSTNKEEKNARFFLLLYLTHFGRESLSKERTLEQRERMVVKSWCAASFSLYIYLYTTVAMGVLIMHSYICAFVSKLANSLFFSNIQGALSLFVCYIKLYLV